MVGSSLLSGPARRPSALLPAPPEATVAPEQSAPEAPAGEPPRVPLRALWHLGQVALVLGLASLVPYAFDSLTDYRYWQRVDASPLWRAVTFAPPPQIEAPTPAAAEAELTTTAVDELAGVTPAPTSAPTVPPGTPQAAADLPLSATAVAALEVAPAALGNQKVWITGAPGALDPLHRALEALVAGSRSHVRIAHYGDSHTANDGITHVTRQLLQRRFGDGGHGFALVEGRTQWYAHKGVVRSAGGGWSLVNFLSGNAKDGAYGYGGVAVDGGPGASFTLGTAGKHTASRLTLYFRSQGPATIGARIDRNPAPALGIATAPGTDGSHTWQVADGGHSITWRVQQGRVRLYGGAIERDQGIVYDSLGEVGARGPRWLQADAAHLQRQMELRPPDLLILNYGGNEASDKVSEAKYLERMVKVVERMRAGHPAGACLLIGPGDHGMRKGGKIVSDPDVVRINDWQRKLAAQVGCGFFDARALMGGEGSMGRWVQKGMGWADYSHFTATGEQAMGVGLYRALLHDLRRYRAVK